LDDYQEAAMPILRSIEARVRPGKRQQWGALMREVKSIVDKHGAPLRVLQLQLGGNPNTMLSSALASDWGDFAKRTKALNADAAYQAFLARGAMADVADVVEVRVANDITSEVGSPGEALQNAQIIQVTSLRLLPGKRAKQLEFIKQMREARKGAGLVTATILEQVIGDAGLLHLAWGYADLDAWAKDRAAGAPKGFADIQQRSLADPLWPYSEPVATRVYADITNQL
jgi:hypothetical protein